MAKYMQSLLVKGETSRSVRTGNGNSLYIKAMITAVFSVWTVTAQAGPATTEADKAGVKKDAQPAAGGATQPATTGAAAEKKTGEKAEAPETAGAVPSTPKKDLSKSSLSVNEAIELALANNLTLREAKLQILALRPRFRRSFGKYGWTLNGGASYGIAETVSDSQTGFSPDDTTSRVYDAGISKKFSSGTTIGASMSHSSVTNSGNNAFTIPGGGSTTLFNEDEYGTAIDFSVQQELLKNFFGQLDRMEDERALTAIEQDKFALLAQLNSVAITAIFNYWNVTAQERSVETTQQILNNAINIRNVILLKRRRGLAERHDVNEANANVSRAESNLAEARKNLYRARIDLLATMNLPAGTTIKGVTDFERELPKEALDFNTIYNAAVKNRYDIEQMKRLMKLAGLEKEIADQSALPSVVLEGGVTGKGGSTSSATDTFGDAATFAFKDYRIGVRATYPLWNEDVKGRQEEALLKKKASKVALENALGDVRATILKSINDIKAAHEVMLASQKSAKETQAQYFNLATEFRKGRFTVNLITQANNNLGEAQLRALQAEIAFNQALLQLEVEKNTLLSKYGIDVENISNALKPNKKINNT